MKSFAKICVVLLASLTLMDGSMNAQTDSASANTNTPSAVTPKRARPRAKRFQGKIASVDADAKTITLEGTTPRLIQLTSKTKIFFNGAPGTLADAAVGLRVSGTERADASTNWSATTLHIGETKRPAPTPPPTTSAPADK